MNHTKYAKQKESEVEVLTNEVVQLHEVNQKLADRVESLQLSSRQKDTVQAVNEQRMRGEIRRLEEDRTVLQNYLRDGASSTEELEKLRLNLADALRKNDALVSEGRQTANAHRYAMEMQQQAVDRAETSLASTRKELAALRRDYDVVLTEREEAAGALRRAIEMAKGLSAKVAEEQMLREDAENRLAAGQKRMQDILRAKEQVSYAVLDALHKERALQTSVSRTLSEMRKREEVDDRGANQLNVSQDSLNASFEIDEEADGSPKATPNSGDSICGSLEPPVNVTNAWRDKVFRHESQTKPDGPSQDERPAISTSNTPNPRPPLHNDGSLTPLINLYISGANASRTKRTEAPSGRHDVPSSPEHLDIGHPPSIRNHLIGDLKR